MGQAECRTRVSVLAWPIVSVRGNIWVPACARFLDDTSGRIHRCYGCSPTQPNSEEAISKVAKVNSRMSLKHVEPISALDFKPSPYGGDSGGT